MNYIKLINAFWQVRRERADMDPYVISLYFALLDIANRSGWNTFTVYREDIILLSGMSHNSYYKARKVLKESGLIEFTDGSNKLSKCSFSVLAVSFPGTQRDTQQGHDEVHNEDTTGTQRDTILFKPLNNKTYKPLNNIESTPSTEAIEAIEKSLSELEKDTVTAKEKKASQTGAAKPKTTAHLFQDSEYSNLETFKSKFTGSEYETADLAYYYRAVSDWSAAGGNKKVDWIATARGFMNRDSKEGKLATNKAKIIPINQQSQMSSRLDLANRVSNMFQYDEQGKMI